MQDVRGEACNWMKMREVWKGHFCFTPKFSSLFKNACTSCSQACCSLVLISKQFASFFAFLFENRKLDLKLSWGARLSATTEKTVPLRQSAKVSNYTPSSSRVFKSVKRAAKTFAYPNHPTSLDLHKRANWIECRAEQYLAVRLAKAQ